jgi:hypothetical protein
MGTRRHLGKGGVQVKALVNRRYNLDQSFIP